MDAMGMALLGGAASAAAGDWAAVARRNKGLEYLFKPLAMAALIAAAAVIGADAPSRQLAFTLAALSLSLAGDVFLMIPDGRRFVPGLASFLLAHLCYVIALTTPATPWPLWPAVLALALAAGFAYFSRLRRSLVAAGRRRLQAPIALYVVAIALMVASAVSLLGRDDVPRAQAALAAAGAVLFAISDGFVGWNRFARPLAWAPVAIMVLYHLGQAGLVAALVR